VNKIIILIIILIAVLYISTGRHVDVQRNLSEEGWVALVEEPFWIMEWVGNKLGNTKQDINNAIDGKTLGHDPNVQ